MSQIFFNCLVTELFVAATFNDTSTTTPPICVMNMTHPRFAFNETAYNLSVVAAEAAEAVGRQLGVKVAGDAGPDMTGMLSLLLTLTPTLPPTLTPTLTLTRWRWRSRCCRTWPTRATAWRASLTRAECRSCCAPCDSSPPSPRWARTNPNPNVNLSLSLTLTPNPNPNPSPTPTPNQVGKNGLGVLWNLCDSDDHWSAFLQEGPAMVAVLLSTMQQHPSNKVIEESVIDML